MKNFGKLTLNSNIFETTIFCSFNYANLWQSIIEADLKNIEYWSRQLGSYEMYPLLATIVTGRSWEVVGDQGIQKYFSYFLDDNFSYNRF